MRKQPKQLASDYEANHSSKRVGQREGSRQGETYPKKSKGKATPYRKDSFDKGTNRAPQEGAKIVSKSVIPTREYSRLNGRISAVSDSTYLEVLMQNFLPNSAGGTANIQSQIDTSLRSILPRESMKDLTADDLADGPDYITLVWELYFAYVAQYQIRLLAPAHVGAIDAAGTTTESIWTTDSWNVIRGRLANILIPTGLNQLTVELQPIIITSLPQPVRRYKGSATLLWSPSYTAAAFLTALGTLQTLTEAGNYFAKCGVPMEKIKIDFAPIMKRADEVSSYMLWLKDTVTICRRNTANTGIFAFASGARQVDTVVLDADVLTGFITSATWYTSTGMLALPGEPFDEKYALTRMLNTYDATHNITGCVSFAVVATMNAQLGVTLAAGTMYVAQIAHDATTFNILSAANAIDLEMVSHGIIASQTNSTCLKVLGDAGVTIAVGTAYHKFLEYATIEEAWIADAESNYLGKVIGGKYLGTRY